MKRQKLNTRGQCYLWKASLKYGIASWREAHNRESPFGCNLQSNQKGISRKSHSCLVGKFMRGKCVPVEGFLNFILKSCKTVYLNSVPLDVHIISYSFISMGCSNNNSWFILERFVNCRINVIVRVVIRRIYMMKYAPV